MKPDGVVLFEPTARQVFVRFRYSSMLFVACTGSVSAWLSHERVRFHALART